MFGIDVGSIATGIPLKYWLYGGLAAVLITVGTIGYVKYHNMETTIREQAATLQAYDLKVTQQEKLIGQQQFDLNKQKEIRSGLETQLKNQAFDFAAYKKRFEGQGKKSFSARLNFDPVGMQKYINQDTKDSLRCLEIVTGSPLTEAEKNEKDILKGNSVCPAIANPRIVP
jgi:hypothetical protein